MAKEKTENQSFDFKIEELKNKKLHSAAVAGGTNSDENGGATLLRLV